MIKLPVLAALLVFANSAYAIQPDVIIRWCSERELADKYPDDASGNYHTEAVLGYLTAVLDSLHEGNPACHYQISGRQFCDVFKSYMNKQGNPGKSSFKYAREAISRNFRCNEESGPGK